MLRGQTRTAVWLFSLHKGCTVRRWAAVQPSSVHLTLSASLKTMRTLLEGNHGDKLQSVLLPPHSRKTGKFSSSFLTENRNYSPFCKVSIKTCQF